MVIIYIFIVYDENAVSAGISSDLKIKICLVIPVLEIDLEICTVRFGSKLPAPKGAGVLRVVPLILSKVCQRGLTG